MIDDIIRFSFLLFTYFLAYLSVRKITNIKSKINIISVASVFVVAMLNFFGIKMTNDILKGIITYSGFTIYAFEIRRKLNKETIVDGFISYVHVVALDIVLAILVSTIGFSDFITKYDNLSIYKLIYSSICSIIMYYSLYVKYWYNFLSKIKKSLYSSKVFLATISLILLIIETATIVTLMKTKSIKDVMLTITLVALFMACLAYLLYNALKKQDLTLKNDNLILQSDTLLKILNNYKLFKHNMKHELMLIESVGNEKVKKLVKEYINEHSSLSSTEYTKGLEKIPNSLKNMIYQKLLEKADARFDIFIENEFEIDPFENLSSKKLSVLFQCVGILLDNGIEAASAVEKGFVYIEFRHSNDKIEILFKNKFDGEISVDSITTPGETSKDNHLGVGMSYICSQKQIDSKITIRNDVFVVSLII